MSPPFIRRVSIKKVINKHFQKKMKKLTENKIMQPLKHDYGYYNYYLDRYNSSSPLLKFIHSLLYRVRHPHIFKTVNYY